MVTASTQRQALNALVFLYKHVLDIQLEDKIAPARSKRLKSPPTVMIKAEVQRVLSVMEGKPALMANLIYGSGMRLMECIRLRVQDVDLGQNLIFIRGGKGGKGRTTILPRNLRDELQSQIIHSDRSLKLFVIVRLDRSIQCFLDSPIKSGNDIIAVDWIHCSTAAKKYPQRPKRKGYETYMS